MPSYAITGKPGGSKSYYVVRYVILEELLNSERVIVTNVPLVLGKIKAWCKMKGKDVDVSSRIQLLEYEDVKAFWRFRGPLKEALPDISKEQCARGTLPDFEGGVSDDGVLYVLDELHEHLNSRQWKDTGPVVLYYIAKHRHLGDDVYWITHAVKNVDSQWRDRTQEYIYCRNFGKEKFKGFTRGTGFQAISYLEPYTGQAQIEQWVKYYSLDKQAAQCYKTSIFNKKADVGQRLKGMPIWVLFVAICLGFFLLWWVTEQIPKWVVGKDKAANKNVSTVVHLPEEPKQVLNFADKPVIGTLQDIERDYQIVSIPLKYSPAHKVIDALKLNNASVAQVGVTANATNDAVILTGTDFQQLITYGETVKQFDRECAVLTVQCLVARRLDSKSNDVGLFDYLARTANPDSDTGKLLEGLAYDLASGLVTFGGSVTARHALDVVTQFVSSDGSFDVMSNPTLSVLSGKEAKFGSGREIPVPTTVRDASGSQTSIEYKKAEFSLSVRPTLKEDGSIAVEIIQQNSDVLETTVIAGNQIPTLSTQELRTEIDIRSNQLLYLGGIKTTLDQKSNKGTPYARKIPVVNWFVGKDTAKNERAELFVMLAVQVWKSGDYPQRVERAIPLKKGAMQNEKKNRSR